ncbi:MAG: magnesium/cobalt transporter CorA [Acidobacteriota bacterium]|nr:magnesium/cobalt transporter CorA [Acidobacteriota bacterium]
MFEKHNPKIGARPGTLAIPPDSPFPKITVVQYDVESVDRREIEDVTELRSFRESDRVTWVDVQGLGDEATIREIGEIFDLHPVALENAVNVPQRAKTELYENHQLVIARTPIIEDDGLVRTPQVCFVLGKHYVLTFQERYFGFFDPVRERIQAGIGAIRLEGPDYLAYALIDAMIDRYYPVAQNLSDGLEELEDIVVENPHPDVLGRIHALRRQLVVLRRIGWPQREAVNAMLRERTPFIGDQEKVYLRDTYDHIAQIVELIDSAREMASDLADAYLSNVSHRTNEIMKMLTLMASIFIPLTFVAGIYGMNFENMPELRSRVGYFVVWGVMLVVAVGMTLYFRHRGWVGSIPPPEFKTDRSDEEGS